MGHLPTLGTKTAAWSLALLGVGALVAAATSVGAAPARAQDAGSADHTEGRATEPTATGDETAVDDGADHQPAPVDLRAFRRAAGDAPLWQRGISAFGLFVLIGLAWAMSSHRRRIPWRVIGWGVGLQLAFGVFVLKTDVGLWLFSFLNDAVIKLLEFTGEGTRFIFGKYATEEFTFALNVLPTIIFFSSLMTVLYHLGVMHRVVSGIAWLMQRTMGTSGSETLSAAANIFLGQTEAPLVVKPFVGTMTRSELNAVMVGGFATVAGGVLAAYVGMLNGVFPDIAGHLIAASVMSAPAALVVAKVMLPETESSLTAGTLRLEIAKEDANVIDAAARGAGEGLKLALNVGAMLLAFLALVALLNYLVGLPAELYNGYVGEEIWQPLTLQRIFGYLLWPLAFIMGVPPEDCMQVAALLGEKLVFNEFVAYLHLGEALEESSSLSPRAVVIATYALCGFANFSSIAIQLGGIGGMAEHRRGELAQLGLRAMLGGTIAACMTAAVAGILI